MLKPTRAIGSCRQAASSWSVTDAHAHPGPQSLPAHAVTQPGSRAERLGRSQSQQFPLQLARVDLGPRSAVGSQLSSGNLLNRNNSAALDAITHFLHQLAQTPRLISGAQPPAPSTRPRYLPRSRPAEEQAVAEQGGAREHAAPQGHAPLKRRNYPALPRSALLPTTHRARCVSDGKALTVCFGKRSAEKPACLWIARTVLLA